jgi:hypothetical protein
MALRAPIACRVSVNFVDRNVDRLNAISAPV